MYDIHSHILPGVDDGAQTLDAALLMLEMAVEDGITTQVLTPHIQSGRYNNNPANLHKAFSEFSETVKSLEIPISLYLSTEVRIEPDLLMLLQQEDFPWLGVWHGKRAFLLEMPHNHIPVGSINLVSWLIDHDILPLIVHPERNIECQNNVEKLRPFIEMGCGLQITSGSLTGKFGKKACDLAVRLLQEKLVMLMATDCHNISYRPPDLSAGLKIAENIIGKKEATTLVYDNPEELLATDL